MSLLELRTKYLQNFSTNITKAREYEFRTRAHSSRIRNKKRIALTGLGSLTKLTNLKRCCKDQCMVYFTTDQLVSERIKYPFNISVLIYFFVIYKLRCTPDLRSAP